MYERHCACEGLIPSDILANCARKIIASNDGNSLLRIFPTETWLKIFTCLNSENLVKVSNSSVQFQNILRHFRIQFLFPKVLDSLLPYILLNYELSDVFRKCKTVCQTWNQAVSQILLTDAHTNAIRDSKLQKPPTRSRIFEVIFQTKENVSEFENHFQASHIDKNINPFANGYIVINRRTGGLQNDLFSPLFELLKTCSDHVWYCDIILNSCGFGNGLKLERILKVCPNLKILNLTVFTSSAIRDLPGRILIGPVPVVSNLLFVNAYDYTYQCLFSGLLQNSNRMIQVAGSSTGIRLNNLVPARPTPMLEEIILCRFMHANFKLISRLEETWPLRKIHLDLFRGIGKPEEDLKMPQYFKTLETKFGNTLQELYILFSKFYEGGDIGSIELPNLEKLFLVVQTWLPMDFILPTRNNLRELNVKVEMPWKPILDQSEGQIKFFTVRFSMLKSNIWDIFPRLEKVTYKQFTSKLWVYERSQVKYKTCS